jgi:hypothetical protein
MVCTTFVNRRPSLLLPLTARKGRDQFLRRLSNVLRWRARPLAGRHLVGGLRRDLSALLAGRLQRPPVRRGLLLSGLRLGHRPGRRRDHGRLGLHSVLADLPRPGRVRRSRQRAALLSSSRYCRHVLEHEAVPGHWHWRLGERHGRRHLPAAGQVAAPLGRLWLDDEGDWIHSGRHARDFTPLPQAARASSQDWEPCGVGGVQRARVHLLHAGVLPGWFLLLARY